MHCNRHKVWLTNSFSRVLSLSVVVEWSDSATAALITRVGVSFASQMETKAGHKVKVAPGFGFWGVPRFLKGGEINDLHNKVLPGERADSVNI